METIQRIPLSLSERRVSTRPFLSPQTSSRLAFDWPHVFSVSISFSAFVFARIQFTSSPDFEARTCSHIAFERQHLVARHLIALSPRLCLQVRHSPSSSSAASCPFPRRDVGCRTACDFLCSFFSRSSLPCSSHSSLILAQPQLRTCISLYAIPFSTLFPRRRSNSLSSGFSSS